MTTGIENKLKQIEADWESEEDFAVFKIDYKLMTKLSRASRTETLALRYFLVSKINS
jgi:hypothetical protein